MMRLRWPCLLCLILLTAACDFAPFGLDFDDEPAGDPAALTVEARRTETAVAAAVEATLAAQQPALIIPNIESVSLRLEASVEGSGRSGSFFGGEAVFRARGAGQLPDLYLTYRLPDFSDDVALLVLDGVTYTRQSRFMPWTRAALPLDIQLFPGMTPSQAAAAMFGFTLSLDQWERVGVETLDGRETIRYRRSYQPQPEAWQRVVGLNFAGVERVDLDLWVSTADSLPRRLHMALLARLNASEAPTLIQITIEVMGYNEPVEFPTPF